MKITGLFVGSALGLATVSEEVKQDAKDGRLAPVLIQMTPPAIPRINLNLRMAAEADMDSYAADVYSSLKRHARKSGKNVRQILDEQVALGAIPPYRFYSISNTYAVEAQPWLIERLAEASDVEEITPNKLIPSVVQSNDNTLAAVKGNVNWTGDQVHWSLQYINATRLPPSIYSKAAQLRYGSADSGVEFTHPAIANNYFGYQSDGSFDHNYAWWDAIKSSNSTGKGLCSVNTSSPCDDSNHGTHTTGTVVGLMNIGVSPTSKWMGCKNMFNNLGSPETYLGCLQFFLAPTNLQGTDPKPELRPHVVGNSYSCPSNEGCSHATFNYALRALKASGVFISVSAGNEGRGGCSTINAPPAVDPNAFNVAATSYMSQDRASFSSIGPVPERPNLSLDISAPGVNITSCIRGNKYASLQGTSMASPHISGTVLLVMATCPQLIRKVDLVADLLRRTATPVYPTLGCGNDATRTLPNNEYGYGIVNVARAINECHSI
ncbi:hypothetical protein DSO57_1027057 [Entomophthora muscae]|uniref:Uncharacterized protein n=1 Tax=Entomophthora muscae TaxID=34485 RepID=A0ACC2RGN7_9FUNG|nr:hypothetical protein DSO57_1027057 [Entomophthora muscae]